MSFTGIPKEFTAWTKKQTDKVAVVAENRKEIGWRGEATIKKEEWGGGNSFSRGTIIEREEKEETKALMSSKEMQVTGEEGSLLKNSSLLNQMREQEVFPQHLIYLLSQDFGSRGPRLNEREKIMCQAVHLHLKSTEETVWMLNCLLLQHTRRRWWWRWRWRRGLLQRKLVLLSLHSVDPLPFRRKRGLLGMMSSIPFVNLRHQNRGWKNEEQKLKN